MKGEHPELRIVGIGASAGGVEALKEFFGAVKASEKLAFVVVQHLSPDYKSLMGELLSRVTPLRVHMIEDGMAVRENEVYLIPPGFNLTLKARQLHLTPQDRSLEHGVHLPIDIFFHSLAEQEKELAIGIILSGTGSDGTRGAIDIVTRGGVVLCQEPSSAKFDGMIQSCLNGCRTAHSLPLQAMPEFLQSLAAEPLALEPLVLDQARAKDELAGVYAIMAKELALDLYRYQPKEILRAVKRQMGMLQIQKLVLYEKRLKEEPELRQWLFRALFPNSSYFFRDPTAFSELSHRVIKPLVANATKKELKIWVPGCGSGEEAYSLALLLHEEIERQESRVSFKVFATDIDQEALDIAARGLYSEAALHEVAEPLRNRYFLARDQSYAIRTTLSSCVVFAQHDALVDPPFINVDLISCRYLFELLTSNAKLDLARHLHFSLLPTGSLFLGQDESPPNKPGLFTALFHGMPLYQKVAGSRMPAKKASFESLPSSPARAEPREQSLEDLPLVPWLLDYFLQDGFLLNQRTELIHSVGLGHQILTVREGPLDRHIESLVPPSLGALLKVALFKVERDQEDVELRQVPATLWGKPVQLQLHLSGVFHPPKELRFVVVRVKAAEDPSPRSDPFVFDAKEGADALAVRHLENQLALMTADLEAALANREVINEELQSTNEELTSANEELQSTNEELQSVNEELLTVNSQYQAKFSEYAKLETQMEGLSQLFHLEWLVLGQDGTLVAFSPGLSAALGLLPSDIHRPIESFQHRFHPLDMASSVALVLSKGEPVGLGELQWGEECFEVRGLPMGGEENEVIFGLVRKSS